MAKIIAEAGNFKNKAAFVCQRVPAYRAPSPSLPSGRANLAKSALDISKKRATIFGFSPFQFFKYHLDVLKIT
jgi:hypothetical protein